MSPTNQRRLLVHAHPVPESFNSALRDVIVDTSRDRVGDIETIDLYAEGFLPERTQLETSAVPGTAPEDPRLAHHLEALQAATHLIFVYPTWWSGPPAILKGWFDRVWTSPQRIDVNCISIVTTHGSGRLRNLAQGQAGRRMILRSARRLGTSRCKGEWIAMYNLDRASDQQRARFLERVRIHFSKSLA